MRIILRSFLSIIIIIGIVFSYSVSVFGSENKVKILLNGEKLETNLIIVSDRILIPVRAIFEKLGAKVEWIDESKRVIISDLNNKIEMQIGNGNAKVNGKSVSMYEPAKMFDSYTYVSLRFLTESFGYDVKWDEKNKTVNINKKEKVTKTKNSVKTSERKIEENYVEIKSEEKNGNDYVYISGINFDKYNIFRLTNKERIVIDIENAKVKENCGKYNINGKYIDSIRYSQFEENTVRVVIDTKGQFEYYFLNEGERLLVEIHDTAYKNIKYLNSNEKKLTISGVVLEEDACKIDYQKEQKTFKMSFSKKYARCGAGWLKINDGSFEYIRVYEDDLYSNIVLKAKKEFDYVFESSSENKATYIKVFPEGTSGEKTTKDEDVIKNNSNKIVVIDAGHGDHDPGAVYDDVKEKDLNLDICIRLEKLLEKSGVKTYMTREDDVFVGLYNRAEFANNLNAALFLSVHNNAYNKSANGTETLYNPDKNYEGDLSGSKFANIIQEELVKKLGLFDRGIVKRPELAVLRYTNMPAVLVEIGFITNDNDRKLLKQESFRQKAAEALKEGILKALQLVD